MTSNDAPLNLALLPTDIIRLILRDKDVRLKDANLVGANFTFTPLAAFCVVF